MVGGIHLNTIYEVLLWKNITPEFSIGSQKPMKNGKLSWEYFLSMDLWKMLLICIEKYEYI